MIGHIKLSIFLLFISGRLLAEGYSKSQIDSINAHAISYLNKDLDSAYLIANVAYDHSTITKYFYGIARSFAIQARSLDLKGYHNSGYLLHLEALYNLNKSDTTDLFNEYSLLVNLGRGQHIFKQFQKAIDLYDSANAVLRKYIDRYPDIVEKYGDRQLQIQLMLDVAENYRLLGQLDMAEELLYNAEESALDQRSTTMLAATYNQLGLIYKTTGNFVKAREYYSIIINSKPNEEQLWKANHNMAVAYMEDGQYQEAEEYFTRAIEVSSEFIDKSKPFVSRLYMGKSFTRQSKNESAIEIWEAAVRKNPMIKNNIDHFIIYKYIRDAYGSLNNKPRFDYYLSKFDQISIDFIHIQKTILEGDRAIHFKILDNIYHERKTLLSKISMLMFQHKIGVLIALLIIAFLVLFYKIKNRNNLRKVGTAMADALNN